MFFLDVGTPDAKTVKEENGLISINCLDHACWISNHLLQGQKEPRMIKTENMQAQMKPPYIVENIRNEHS